MTPVTRCLTRVLATSAFTGTLVFVNLYLLPLPVSLFLAAVPAVGGVFLALVAVDEFLDELA